MPERSYDAAAVCAFTWSGLCTEAKYALPEDWRNGSMALDVGPLNAKQKKSLPAPPFVQQLGTWRAQHGSRNSGRGFPDADSQPPSPAPGYQARNTRAHFRVGPVAAGGGRLQAFSLGYSKAEKIRNRHVGRKQPTQLSDSGTPRERDSQPGQQPT